RRSPRRGRRLDPRNPEVHRLFTLAKSPPGAGERRATTDQGKDLMTMRSPVSPELRALLQQERVIPPVSAMQRARALARARASLKSTAVAPVAAPFAAAPRTRWAAAAAAALVISAAVGAAAYEIHSRSILAPVAPRAVASAPRAVVSAPPAPAPAVAVAELPSAPAPTAAPSGLSAADAARAELHLLRQARGAVSRGD